MAFEDLSGIGGAGSGGITGGGGGGGASLADVADAERVEYRTLTLGEFTAKQMTLVNAPHAGGKTKLDIIEGSTQYFGIDYTLAGAVLDWTGLGLDGLLAQGDTLRITYLTS